MISQLLTEMDGLIALQNVVVIAATNRPDIVDPALIRPGRFDRLIYVPAPDIESRLEILKIYTKEMPLEKEIDFTHIQKNTKGYSGADLRAICSEAAMNAMRKQNKTVSMNDFKKAMETIGPTISKDVDTWYRSTVQQFKKPVKTATPIA
jgi:transitional endoplasmic reticulum ATPase